MNVEPPQEMEAPYLDGFSERAWLKNRRRLLQVVLATLMPRLALADGGVMCTRSALGSKRSCRRVCLVANTTHWLVDGATPGGVVEIGAVELNGWKLTGRKLHTYINSNFEVDHALFEHHGLSRESLVGAPSFANFAFEFARFIRGAELVMTEERESNWVDTELSRLTMPPVKALCNSVTYTFDWYREIHGDQSPLSIRAGLRKIHNISELSPIPTALDGAMSLALAYIQLQRLALTTLSMRS